jgi:hypothetical protein
VDDLFGRDRTGPLHEHQIARRGVRRHDGQRCVGIFRERGPLAGGRDFVRDEARVAADRHDVGDLLGGGETTEGLVLAHGESPELAHFAEHQ